MKFFESKEKIGAVYTHYLENMYIMAYNWTRQSKANILTPQMSVFVRRVQNSGMFNFFQLQYLNLQYLLEGHRKLKMQAGRR